ncbi:hypothetical protein GCM10009616_14730 [Microlunatus lacustris]
MKDATKEELFRAVEAAARGRAVLAPAVTARLMGQVRRPVSESLSRRELVVLELIARGSTNRGAANQLFVSEATIKSHLLHICAKLGVDDRAAAVATAFSRGNLLPSRGLPDRRRSGGQRPRSAAGVVPPPMSTDGHSPSWTRADSPARRALPGGRGPRHQARWVV